MVNQRPSGGADDSGSGGSSSGGGSDDDGPPVEPPPGTGIDRGDNYTPPDDDSSSGGSSGGGSGGDSGSSSGGSSGSSGSSGGGSSGGGSSDGPATTRDRMEQARRTRPDPEPSEPNTTAANTHRRMERARRTRPDPGSTDTSDGPSGGGSDGPPVEDDVRSDGDTSTGGGGQSTSDRTVVATNVEDDRTDLPGRFSGGQVDINAHDAEDEYLENNPQYDESDVDVDLVEVSDGEYAFTTSLNESGEQQQQENVTGDIESQLEEEYGADFTRGEDFTVEETDDGYVPNFTDAGERRAAAADIDSSTYTDVDVSDVQQTDDGWELSDDASTEEAQARREEVPAEHRGPQVAAEVEAYVEQREAAEQDLERQLEDQVGRDLERGEDFTIEETDEGLSAELTDEGLSEQAASQTEAQFGRNAIRAAAGSIAGPGVAEGVAQSVDAETARDFSGVEVDPESDIAVEESGGRRRATISEEGAESISEQQMDTVRENVIQGLEEQTNAELDEEDVTFTQEDGQVTGRLSEQGEEQVAVENSPFSDVPVVGGITTSGSRVRTRMRQTFEPARDWWDENTPGKEDIFGAATVTAPVAAAEPTPLGEVGVGTLVAGGAVAGATAYAGNVALGERPDAQARVQTPAEGIANTDVTPSQTSVEVDVGNDPVFPAEERVPTEDPMEQPEIPAPTEPASRPFPTGQAVPDEVVQTTREQVPDAGDAAYQQPEIEVDARPSEQTDPRQLNFRQVGAGVVRTGQEEIEDEEDAFRPEISQEDIPANPWEDVDTLEVDERGIATRPEVVDREPIESGQRVRTWPGQETMESEIEQTSELQQQFESEIDSATQQPGQWTNTTPQSFEENATDTMAMQDVNTLQDAAQAQTVMQRQAQENQLGFETPGTDGYGFPETVSFAEEPGYGYGYEYQYGNQSVGRFELPGIDEDDDSDPFHEFESESEVFGTGFASADELAERFEL